MFKSLLKISTPSTFLNLSYIADPHFMSFIPWLNLILTVHFYYLTGVSKEQA